MDGDHNEMPCRYFQKVGPTNTKAVMAAVAGGAEKLGINKIILATNTGNTAYDALERLGSGKKVIAVTHATGFREPNHQEMSDETRRDLESKGISVLTGLHAFAGVGRGIKNKTSALQVEEIIAFTLRLFGQGTKVAVELPLMAADAGLIRTDEDVISIGGTGRGADTALVIQPANSFNIFDLKVKAVICKPAVF
jgi:hypothetical protein